jgi:hypothetical protein
MFGSRLVVVVLLTAAIAVVVTAAAPHRINEFVVRLISIIVVVVVIFGGPSVSHTVFLFIFHPTSFVCAGSLRLCIYLTPWCKNNKILDGHTRPEDYFSPLPHEYIAEEDLRKCFYISCIC